MMESSSPESSAGRRLSRASWCVPLLAVAACATMRGAAPPSGTHSTAARTPSTPSIWIAPSVNGAVRRLDRDPAPFLDAVTAVPPTRPQAYREVPPDLRGRVLTVSQMRLLRAEEKRREGRAGDPPAIRPGMMFEIEVAGEPLLSRTLVVDVDGQIDLPCIGKILVIGWTQESLHSYLREYYWVQYGRASIAVRVERCPRLVSTTIVALPRILVAHRGGDRASLPLWEHWRQYDDYRNAGIISLAPDCDVEVWRVRPGPEGAPSILIVPDPPDPMPASAPEEGADIVEENVWEDPDDEPGDVWLIPRVEKGEPVPDDWNRALRILRSGLPILESLQEWDQPLPR